MGIKKEVEEFKSALQEVVEQYAVIDDGRYHTKPGLKPGWEKDLYTALSKLIRDVVTNDGTVKAAIEARGSRNDVLSKDIADKINRRSRAIAKVVHPDIIKTNPAALWASIIINKEDDTYSALFQFVGMVIDQLVAPDAKFDQDVACASFDVDKIIEDLRARRDEAGPWMRGVYDLAENFLASNKDVLKGEVTLQDLKTDEVFEKATEAVVSAVAEYVNPLTAATYAGSWLPSEFSPWSVGAPAAAAFFSSVAWLQAVSDMLPATREECEVLAGQKLSEWAGGFFSPAPAGPSSGDSTALVVPEGGPQ